MTTKQERLDALKELPENWDTYGALKPDPASIDYAKTWIATFQQECGEKWIEPSSISPMGWTAFEHEVCFEWYIGKRTLNLCVNSKEASGLQIWDSTDPNCRMDDCDGNTPEERATLWAWLTEDAAIIESLKHIQWIPTTSSEPCPQCEQAKREDGLDLAGALQAMADFHDTMTTLQASAGNATSDIASVSEGILKLAKSEEQA